MPSIPSNKPYRVGRSPTGLGLFATKPIKKGSKIIRYFGPLLDSKKKKDDAIENKYLFELNDRWTIDGSVRKNIARYINHACKPNAESDVKPRKRKVFIRAIKNIEPGEEINYDYGTDYFKAYLKPIGCKCAACEKKRKKQRAEARAEKARLKARAERKALKKAEKLAKEKAKERAKLKEKAERKSKKKLKLSSHSLNGKSLTGKSLNGKSRARKSLNAKSLNGKHLNGNSRVRVAGKKSAGRKLPVSAPPAPALQAQPVAISLEAQAAAI
ncbi:SET domain-containing protein [Bradyrhizobium sp. SRL28]|uniref:SET domain-containing protein n=1 Tax=Bradyrhizobium sp. SRL28 TaxID=2836178 RepID=UPI001BDDCE54|nr:SET domain-containing protein [Bradyrhizobium sp. SRL28]MBT1511615.1 SET domain-containing protein [Bradyrhizobium sp. SRL28]